MYNKRSEYTVAASNSYCSLVGMEGSNFRGRRGEKWEEGGERLRIGGDRKREEEGKGEDEGEK